MVRRWEVAVVKDSQAGHGRLVSPAVSTLNNSQMFGIHFTPWQRMNTEQKISKWTAFSFIILAVMWI